MANDETLNRRPKRDPNGRVLDLMNMDPAEARELHDAFVEAFDALGDDETPVDDGPMRDRYGRPIQAAPWKQLDFGGDPFPMELFDLMEMLPYGDDEETKR